ncbi:MAG TPA: rhodanese-like domain-containing protein [Acidimicrobiia bacterium]|nr:rhodanese-like domain-containing protein [Acidimicrobiia bacterium]
MARRDATDRARTVDELLDDARGRFTRLSATEACARLDDGAVLVDVRTESQRAAGGEIPGALVIALNHLEWRLDPRSVHRVDAASDHDVEVIVLCQEGYSSSLAAARLHDLGLHRATDVIGGFDAWRRAGLPVTGGAG